MLKKSRLFLAVCLCALALVCGAFAEGEGDSPSVELSLVGEPATYAMVQVQVTLKNCVPDENYTGAPFQYAFAAAGTSRSAIGETEWENYWEENNRLLCSPTQYAKNEKRMLFIRARHGEGWEYAQETLNFTALADIPVDSGMALSLPDYPANTVQVPVNTNLNLRITGISNGSSILATGPSMPVCRNWTMTPENYTYYSGEKTGSLDLCILATRDGSQVRSNILPLQVADMAPIGDSSCSEGAVSVPQNGAYTVTVTPGANATYCEVYLKDETQGWNIGSGGMPVKQPGVPITIQVPLQDGAVGDSCSAEILLSGKSGTETRKITGENLRFTISEPVTTSADNVFLNLDTERAVTDENVWGELTARGASRLSLSLLDPDGQECNTVRLTEYEAGNEWTPFFFLMNAGTGEYTLQATAEYPDGHTATVSRKVTAVEPAEEETAFVIPDCIVREEGAVLSFPMTENMSVLEVTVDNGKGGLLYTNEQAAEIRLGAAHYGDSNWLRVQYYFTTDTLMYSQTTRTLPILEKAPGNEISLKAKEPRVLVSEEAELTVSAPGAESVTLCREGEEISCADGDVLHCRIDSIGKHIFYLRAEYGGRTVYSKPVVIEGYSLGQYPETLRYTVSGAEGGSIPRNGKLKLTIPKGQVLDSCEIVLTGEINNRTSWYNTYHPDIRADEDLVLEIPVAQVSRGGKAVLRITVFRAGYENEYINTDGYTVTDFEGETDEDGFWTDIPETALTGTFFDFAVAYPGADRIGVTINGWDPRVAEDSMIAGTSNMNITEPETVDVTYWAEKDGVRKEGNRQVQYIAPKGKAAGFDISGIPAWLEAGKDAVFTVQMPEQVSHAWVNIHPDQDWQTDLYSEGHSGRQWSFTLPGSALDGIQRINISISPVEMEAGWSIASVSQGIPVMKAEDLDGRVTMTVEPEELMLNDEFFITVHAPDLTVTDGEGNTTTVAATKAEIFAFSNHGSATWQGDGLFTFQSRAYSAGQCLNYAVVTYEDGTKVTSIPFRGNVKSNGAYTEGMEITAGGITDGSIPRGETIRVTVNAIEYPSELNVGLYERLENGGEEYVSGTGFNATAAAKKTTEFRVATLGLKEGKTYRMRIERRIRGYESNEQAITFTVRPFDRSKLVNGIFTDLPAQAMTGEHFQYTIYAPGADSTGLSIPETSFEGSNGGELYNNSISYNVPMTLSYEAWAVFGGERKTRTGTILITAPNGKLAIDASGIPGYIEAGKTAEISIPFPKNGARYMNVSVSLSQRNGGNHITLAENGGLREDWTTTINAADFSVGDMVLVSVYMEPEQGYEYRQEPIEIPVLGTVSDTVTLTAASDSDTVPVNGKLTLTTSAPGANELWLRGYSNDQAANPEAAVFEVWGSEWSGETMVFYLEARYGEETRYSAPLRITTVSAGKYEAAPEIQVDGLTEEGTIARDQKMTIRIRNIPEGAYHYGWIEQPDGSTAGLDLPDAQNGSIDWSRSVIMLKAGQKYTLVINRRMTGYDSETVRIPFTVTEMAQQMPESGIYVEIAKSALTNERIPYVIYTENAAEIGMDVLNGDGGRSTWVWSESSWTGSTTRFDNPEELELIFWAVIDGERKEEHRTIQISAPYGEVTADLSGVPAYLMKGQNAQIVLDVPAPEGAPDVWYEYHYRIISSEGVSDGNSHDTYNQRGRQMIEIPAEALADAMQVTLSMNCCGIGCESAYESVDIPILSGWTTLPENLTRIEEEAFAGSRIEAVEIPAGCTEIGEYAFNGCDRLRIVKFDGMHTTINENAFVGTYDVKFICMNGSDAEAFANEHWIPVIPVEQP